MKTKNNLNKFEIARDIFLNELEQSFKNDNNRPSKEVLEVMPILEQALQLIKNGKLNERLHPDVVFIAQSVLDNYHDGLYTQNMPSNMVLGIDLTRDDYESMYRVCRSVS